MIKYLKYILKDINAWISFKLLYLMEKIFKFPIVLINRYLKLNIKLPYVFSKDFIIDNSDWKWLIQAKSWNDYVISVPNEYFLRESFLTVNNWIFLDIWSHIWKWAITICNKRNNIKSYCFEPNPVTFKYLKESVELNWLHDQINCYNLWVWKEDWVLNFEINTQSAMSKFVVNNLKKSKNIIKVNVVEIDNFIIKENIEKKEIKLIKIDTEWFEFKVLEWMKNLLKLSSDDLKIICEILPNQNDKNKIINYLKSFWFNFKIIWKQDYYFFKD